MQHKEITILVGVHKGNALIPNDCLYYRFFNVQDGKFEKMIINKSKNISTTDLYENFLVDFLIDKQLISVGYDTLKITENSETYLEIKLINSLGEKLNIYFTFNALYAFSKLEKLISMIKKRNFNDEYGNIIENKFGYFKNSIVSIII